jgi:hypothetical protein
MDGFGFWFDKGISPQGRTTIRLVIFYRMKRLLTKKLASCLLFTHGISGRALNKRIMNSRK